MTTDPFDLQRFLDAQAGAYDDALAELKAGRKSSHWMWFIFPQIEGLGASAMSQRYAIRSLAEARAYLAHPVLGPRLLVCVQAINSHEGLSARQLMGAPDDMKLRSSLTLFEAADPQAVFFGQALARYFDGVRDPATLERLARL
jgi:uncharacterized protein (DUF1810 family)